MFRKLFSLCFPFLEKFAFGENKFLDYNLEIKNEHILLIPKGEHTSTLIFMHGLGDVPQSFVELFINSDVEIFPKSTKFVLLKAPSRPVSINFGQMSTSWFDIKGFEFAGDFKKLVNFQEVEESSAMINQIIQEEVQIIGCQNVYLGGFSQGCAMAIFCGLSYPQRVGGIIGLSGFMFPNTPISRENVNTPIFLAHGEEDPLIPIDAALQSYKMLYENQFIFYKEKNLSHSISFQELEEVKKEFLRWSSKQQSEL